MDVLRGLRGMDSIGDQTYMLFAPLVSRAPASGHTIVGPSAAISA